MWIVSRDDLLAALDRVEAAADERSPHPYVGMVLIGETEGGLKLTTTNILMAIETTAPAEFDKHTIAPIAVAHKKLRTMVANMPSDKLKCSLDKAQRLVVKCSGQRQFSLVTTPGEQFIRVPQPDKDAAFIQIDPVALSRGIERVRYAVPVSKDRPQLDAVCLDIKDGKLNLVAMSGATMAIWTEPSEIAPTQVSLPSMIFKALRLAVAQKGDGPFEFSVGAKEVFVQAGNMYIVACLPAGEFPPWRMLMGTLNLHEVARVGAIGMLDTLRAVSAAAPGKGVQITLRDNNTLSISAQGECEAEDSIKVEPCEGAGKLDVYVDPVLCIDTIKGADKDFTLEWTGGDQIAVRTDEGFLGLISLMMLK